MFQYFLGSKTTPTPVPQIEKSTLEPPQKVDKVCQGCSIYSGWNFIEDTGASQLADLTMTCIDREYCIIEDAKTINANEAKALRIILEKLKKEKKAKKINGEINHKLKLQIVELKTKIAFLEGMESESSGKGANGAIFIKWKKHDAPQKKFAVFKLSESIETHEFQAPQGEQSVVTNNYFNTLVQMIGFCTSTSQQAVVCGAGSKNREACAEKAGFMIADKFHNEIIAYIAGKKKHNPMLLLGFNEGIFTPMIAGIVDFMNTNRDKSSIGSIAVFIQNAIDADVAQSHANILEKNLTHKEEVMFQFFVIYDYLIGNADRHEGNWMVKLSCKKDGLPRFPILDKNHLSMLHSQMNLTENDYEIEAIIPIDNANIMPTKEFGSNILDSKQYAWKTLKFASLGFCDEVVDFMNQVHIDDKWVQDICNAINGDMQIKQLCYDVGGTLINPESMAQMKLRTRKLKEIGTRQIKTPRDLAEAPLVKGWL